MSVTKLEKGQDGALQCPQCKQKLVYKDGGQVRVVNGKVDYENVKPRYVCFSCHKFYREMLHSGYFDVFDLEEDEELVQEQAAKESAAKSAEKDNNPVVKLGKDANGKFKCPVCSKGMRCAEGSQIQIVNGRVDYESIKPRYICDDCGKFYRELLNSGLYEVFELEEAEKQPKAELLKNVPAETAQDVDPVVALQRNGSGMYKCPVCSLALEFSDGGQMSVVNGKVDYESIKPRYICHKCGTFYRELLSSGLYEVFKLDEVTPKAVKQEEKKPKKVLKTGDLAPMQLKRDANGRCDCPRCGGSMRFLEPEAVKIVDGKADMSDTVPRFACDECSSVYRRIASTDYYQWSEK